MLLWELFEEQSSNLQRREVVRVSGYTVWPSPHIEDRRTTRGISTDEIARVLTRLNRIKHLIRRMEPHERFAAYDPELDVSLGMMRASSGPDQLLLNTVYRGRPWTLVMPVFDVK